MIEPYRGDPTRERLRLEKYHLDSFSDDNRTTTTFKIRPQYIYQRVPFTFISPFDVKSPIYFKQSLHFPINNRHSFGIESDVIRRKEGYLHNFGLVYSYSDMHDSKIVVRGGVGTYNGCGLQYHKKLDQHRIISLYCSSAVSLKTFYNSFGVGYKYKRFQATMTSKIGFGHVVKINYKYPMYKGITLKLQNVTTFTPQSLAPIPNTIFDTELSLNYRIHKLRCSIIVNTFDPDSLRVQFQARTSIGRLFICNQYSAEQNIIYFGLKRHNCKISIPVVATNSLAVTLMFGVAYLMGLFLRKQSSEVYEIKEQEERIKELRLIQDKANDSYKKEEQSNGLRIQTAYYGDQTIIDQIYNAFITNIFEIPRQPVDLKKVIDVTVSLRYYTQKGKLKLPKSKKSQLFGFCDVGSENPKLLIIYKKGDDITLKAEVVGQNQNIEI